MTQDRRDQATTNFEVYEDKVNFLGIASVTLPNLSFLTAQMSGSGIGGNVNAVIAGMVDAMQMTLNWRNLTNESASLSTPDLHNITLLADQQVEDPINRKIEHRQHKHVFVAIPNTMTGGSIAPASTGDANASYEVRYWAFYIDGVRQIEIDPLNMICYVNGVDYLAEVRANTGK